VHALLRSEELQRYYQLRQGPGARVSDLPSDTRDLSWLADSISENASGQKHLRLDLQGIHCSGCVWIMEKTFKQQAGSHRLIVNPAIGSADLWFDSDFPLEEWVRSIERFGYRFGPALKSHNKKADGLLLRLGICIAIALNVMLLSAALYLGLEEGRLYTLVRGLSYGLASISVVVGGPVFFRSALAGLRNRVLHLDVPISVGILLAFAGSSWAFWSGTDSAMYLDSVSVFIALMLLGRFLQERVLTANRNRLLESDGTRGLRSKLLEADEPRTIPSREIKRGNQLLIGVGDLIPVESHLLSAKAKISTDWINGESSARTCTAGAPLQAGSFNAGDSALRVEAMQDFSASPLESLLRPNTSAEVGAHESGLVRVVSSYYVVGVLIAAAGGFLAWLAATQNPTQALEVATAVLVVTCPCAFGIATPLAHELVQAKLRKEGLYVRAGDFLHRASQIKKVVFDKTGTVTTGSMKLEDGGSIAGFDDASRQALFDLCARSTHPTSAILFEALKPYGLRLREGLEVQEIPGKGLLARIGEHEFRLGLASWACSESPAAATLFCRDGVELARFSIREEPRPDVREELDALEREGFDVFLLSGDSEARVQGLSEELGLDRSHAFAERNPEDKRAWLEANDHGDMLFVGDGINDSLAAQTATCSGTPALDRPYMASHCDFYLGTDRLAPIRSALHAAKKLAHVIRRNLAFALTYNALAIGLAWAGFMSPWLAAILMPASSIAIVLATTATLSPRSASWKS
jgi:Cu2+-exporting ATPase